MIRALLIVVAAALSATAQETPTIEELLQEIERLQARVTALEAERPGNTSTELEERVAALQEAIRSEETSMSAAWAGTTRLATKDGAFVVSFGGRIQFDTVFGSEAEDWNDTIGAAGPLAPLEDGIEFRRVRFGASGRIHDDVLFALEADLTRSHVALSKAWIAFDDVPVLGRVHVGRFKVPFSLSNLTSSQDHAFLERSIATNALAVSRESGVGFRRQLAEGRVLASGMVFRGTDSAGDSAKRDAHPSVALRLTGLPLADDDGPRRRVVHLGAGAVYRNAEDGTTRFSARPGAHFFDARPWDTGVLAGVDAWFVVNVEFAARWGPLSIESEYYRVLVESAANDDPCFQGGYVHLRWFVTGEALTYSRAKGTFGGVTPFSNVADGGPGAWELQAGVSWLDLDDEAVRGGRGLTARLGVAWWLNPRTVVKANWVLAHVDGLGGAGDAWAHTFGIRVQIRF